ncbi:MAG: hypothetical protein AB2784_08290 [Candidatus Thiodiazotropha endolucinida]
MTLFRERETYRLDISDARSSTILHPEKVILHFGARNNQDIGALCYLQRSAKRTGRLHRPVDLRSLNKQRCRIIADVIKYLAERLEHSGTSRSTLSELATSFIAFIDWCDISDHQNVLDSNQNAKAGFREYVWYLQERIRRGEIKPTYAYGLQQAVLQVISDLLNIVDLEEGINLVIGYRNNLDSTNPQDNADSGRVLALCDALFEGLSEFVLNNLPYPFSLKVPATLNCNNNQLWVMPIHVWCMPPHLRSQQAKNAPRNLAWDYQNGCIQTFDNIIHRYSSKYAAENGINHAHKTLADANSNTHHYSRLSRATTASSSFFQLFLANTGMNLESATTLVWHSDYEIVQSRQGFRQIKARAGYKSTSFEIQTKFVKKFKKYLKLRSYLLRDDTCDLLFFSRGRTFIGKPTRLPDSLTTNFSRVLRNIDPLIPNFGARQWRANKSDWLLRNHDPGTTATLLQNKEQTVLKHYSAGSESRATEEMGKYFEHLSLLRNGECEPSGTIDSAIGKCSRFGEAEATEVDPPVPPNCYQPEGCLFCKRYLLHADEIDARKLVSFRYCISQTAHLSACSDHFESIFGPVKYRINVILDLIKNSGKKEADMINRIISEVEEDELLSPYWADKLCMLIELGVINE